MNNNDNITQLLKNYRDLCKKYTSERHDILSKLKKSTIKIADNATNSKVCFILSCPGECELIENKVCAGKTGENLEEIIYNLNKLCPNIFPYTTRYEYNIFNASNIVHFELLDGKSEEDKSVILEENNIDRIKSLLKTNELIEYIILCGDKAKLLKEHLEEFKKYTIAETNHLGMRSINNSVKNDINGVKIKNLPKTERTSARLKVIANKIWDAINKI